MALNALSLDPYSFFFQGIKVLYSRQSKEGDMGFLILGDNYDEYEIPLLPGCKVVSKFVFGVEKLFIEKLNGKEIELQGFESYFSLFLDEIKVGNILKKDQYWRDVFYDKNAIFTPDVAIGWLRLLLQINQDSFGSLEDSHIVNTRNGYLKIIK